MSFSVSLNSSGVLGSQLGFLNRSLQTVQRSTLNTQYSAAVRLAHFSPVKSVYELIGQIADKALQSPLKEQRIESKLALEGLCVRVHACTCVCGCT